MGDLPSHSGSRQMPLRVLAVRPLRIDHRHGRRGPRCRVVMVRDQHIDAAAPGNLDLRRAARAAVGGHDKRAALVRGPINCPQRQAVAVSEPLRHVRHRIKPDRA